MKVKRNQRLSAICIKYCTSDDVPLNVTLPKRIEIICLDTLWESVMVRSLSNIKAYIIPNENAYYTQPQNRGYFSTRSICRSSFLLFFYFSLPIFVLVRKISDFIREQPHFMPLLVWILKRRCQSIMNNTVCHPLS